MTITTFFVGLSWGIVSLKWDDYSPYLGVAALVVWLFAAVFLLMFTLLTEQAADVQNRFKKMLETFPKSQGDGDDNDTNGTKNGRNHNNKPSATYPSKLFFQAIFTGSHNANWVPWYAFLWLTLGFFILVGLWANHASQRKITWTTIVEPQTAKSFSITNATATNGIDFNSVDFTKPDIKPLLTVLTNIEIAISNLKCLGSTNIVVTNDTTVLESNLVEIQKAVAVLTDLRTKEKSLSTDERAQVSTGLSDISNAIANLAKEIHPTVIVTNTVHLNNEGFLLHIGPRSKTEK
jgi:hypothetical protein